MNTTSEVSANLDDIDFVISEIEKTTKPIPDDETVLSNLKSIPWYAPNGETWKIGDKMVGLIGGVFIPGDIPQINWELKLTAIQYIPNIFQDYIFVSTDRGVFRIVPRSTREQLVNFLRDTYKPTTRVYNSAEESK